MSASDAHDAVVRAEFEKQSRGFNDPKLTVAQQKYIDWICKFVPLRPADQVLDVACGTGHLALALCRHARSVVGVDITPAMLRKAGETAAARHIDNARFLEASAYQLPFPDGQFDAVVTRFSLHHLESPAAAIREMARVCNPGGRIVLVDLVAPTSAELAAKYDQIERLRDPSHVRALTLKEIEQGLRQAGVKLHKAQTREVDVAVKGWLSLTKPSEHAERIILKKLRADLHGSRGTGFRPFERGSSLMFRQSWAIVHGTKGP